MKRSGSPDYGRISYLSWPLPDWGGRVAAEGHDAAPMAEADGGGRAPDGHNPEVVPPA